MGKFIRNLLLFTSCFLLVIAGLIVISAFLIRLPKANIGSERHILVLGDSHTECAVDDSVFIRSANFSKSATAFIYTYGAIKKLVADNPQIDTVLLSFQFNSLIYERERGWIYSDALLSSKLPVYLPLLGLSDMGVFICTPAFYKSAARTPLVCAEYYYQLTRGAGDDWRRDNIGRHLSLPYSKLKESVASTTPYEELKRKDSISSVQLEYLLKIGAFCRQRAITLVLINTPVYKREEYTGYQAYERNRQRYLSGFRFLDYSGFAMPDSCFADIVHLNRAGARIFSAYLQNRLSTDLQEQKN
jgi:hypothetical protein